MSGTRPAAAPHGDTPSRPALVPAVAFTLPLRVRSYEVTEAGTVSVGGLLRYLEHLATTASAARGFDHDWYERSGTGWVVREMDLLLGWLPGIDDDVMMATWLSDFRRVQANREYAIWRLADQRLVARARARWAYVDRARGQLTRLPDELVARFGVAGSPMRLRPIGPLSARSTSDPSARADGMLELTARGYECDTQRHVNNTVYADWLTEALERSLAQRLGAPGSPRPRYLRIEYVRPVRAGERVRVSTHIAEQGTRGLRSVQAISGADEQTCLRASMRLLRVGQPRAD